MPEGTVTVRAAGPDDIDDVVVLVESAYRGDSSRAGWTTEADLLGGQRTDADDVRAALPHLLLAAADGELLGCCTLTPKGASTSAAGGSGHFGMFAVRPSLQGHGIGSVLLDAAESRARALGLARVEMTVLELRPELIAFYVRRGYSDTGEKRPFPYGDERLGLPRRDDLEFVVLAKDV